MKRGSFKRKIPQKRVIAEYRRTPKKGWQKPSWLGVIPMGSHGSTPVQKKCWKIVSDFVRIKDYHTYGGYCPGCRQFRFQSYKDGHCGHWKSWGASSGYAKYEIRNLLLICPNCNNNENGQIGFNIGSELIMRYGPDNPEYIDMMNLTYHGKKMEDMILVGMIELLMAKMKDLPEKPDYWDKLITRYEEYNQTL